jgi:hypothetical protein
MAILGFDISKTYKDFLLAWRTPNVLDRKEYRAAEEFACSIETDDNKDYDWVVNYARDNYDRIIKINSILDEKANDIIKFLGGGTGIVTLGVLVNLPRANSWILAAALPSYLCAILSLWMAYRARRPNPGYSPPSIRDAFDYADCYNGKGGQAKFIGRWHEASVSMGLAIEDKAKKVDWAMYFFVLALSLLLIPFLLAIGVPTR